MSMPESWISFLGEGFREKLKKTLCEVDGENVFPPATDRFRAFEVEPDEVKVVLLGQDPYPKRGQATGYAFAFDGAAEDCPHSLRVIRSHLRKQLGCEVSSTLDLRRWSSEGVLLLNTALTVAEGEPGSHLHVWEPITKRILFNLASLEKPPVFALWGKKAQNLVSREDILKRLCVCERHPVRWTKNCTPFKNIDDQVGVWFDKKIDWGSACR